MSEQSGPTGPSLSDLCCIFCCPPLPSKIVSKLAFIPPNPVTYQFEALSNEVKNNDSVGQSNFGFNMESNFSATQQQETEIPESENEEENSSSSKRMEKKKNTPRSRRAGHKSKGNSKNVNNNNIKSKQLSQSEQQTNTNTTSTSISPITNTENSELQNNNNNKPLQISTNPSYAHLPGSDVDSSNLSLELQKNNDAQGPSVQNKGKRGASVKTINLNFQSQPQVAKANKSKESELAATSSTQKTQTVKLNYTQTLQTIQVANPDLLKKMNSQPRYGLPCPTKNLFKFIPTIYSPIEPDDFQFLQRQMIPCMVKNPKNKNKIACNYIKYTSNPEYYRARPPNFVILFSHGNAVDIGQMPPFYTSLAKALRTDIMCYDYSGYGASTGKPSEANLYSDIQAVFKFLIDEFKFPANQIILYGQSIGTVATIDLASKSIGSEAAAVILHSPLLSGWKVLLPNSKKNSYACIDPFPNYSKVSKIQSKVLVIHGTHDEIIGFEHGQEIYQMAANKFDPFWVQMAGHNDIEQFPHYVIRLRKLIKELTTQLLVTDKNKQIGMAVQRNLSGLDIRTLI